LIGSVNAVEDNSILVSTEGARTRYKIPKHVVEGFDGHQVTINIQKPELERFKSDANEGFKVTKATTTYTNKSNFYVYFLKY
jgi:hypothetical protein